MNFNDFHEAALQTATELVKAARGENHNNLVSKEFGNIILGCITNDGNFNLTVEQTTSIWNNLKDSLCPETQSFAIFKVKVEEFVNKLSSPTATSYDELIKLCLKLHDRVPYQLPLGDFPCNHPDIRVFA